MKKKRKILNLQKVKIATLRNPYKIVGGNASVNVEDCETNTNTVSEYCPPETAIACPPSPQPKPQPEQTNTCAPDITSRGC